MCLSPRMSLWFNDFVFDNQDIIFASGSFNGLFRANIESGKAVLMGTFPDEEELCSHLYGGVQRYGDYILFIPAWAKNFAVYDVKQDMFCKIGIEIGQNGKLNSKYNFAYYANILVGKNVYVFGYDRPEIICIDMESLEAYKYDKWQEQLMQFGEREGGPYFYKDICMIGYSLFLVTGQNNCIVELNMNTDQIYIHPVGTDGSYYNTIAYDGTYFWLTEQTQGFLKVDREDWSYQYKEIKKTIHTNYFLNSTFVYGDVWLFSNWDENIFRIYCKDSSFHMTKMIFDREDEWCGYNEQYGYRFFKKISDDKFVISCSQDCKLHLIDKGVDIMQIKFYTEDKDVIEEVYKKNIVNKWKYGNCANEQYRKYFQLTDLMYISGKREIMSGKCCKEYGKLIYDYNKK